MKEWFQGFTPAGATVIAAALVVAVAAADVYTGPGVDVTLLYLAPIGFGTFFAGLGAGVGLAALAAACSVESSRLSGEVIAPAVLAWNAVQQVGVFLALSTILDAFKKRLLHERRAPTPSPPSPTAAPSWSRHGSSWSGRGATGDRSRCSTSTATTSRP
jgi:hypothetical protein